LNSISQQHLRKCIVHGHVYSDYEYIRDGPEIGDLGDLTQPDHRQWIEQNRRLSQVSVYEGFGESGSRPASTGSSYSGFGDDASELDYQGGDGDIGEDKVYDAEESAVISAILELFQSLDVDNKGYVILGCVTAGLFSLCHAAISRDPIVV
jgi:hypothetical protein